MNGYFEALAGGYTIAPLKQNDKGIRACLLRQHSQHRIPANPTGKYTMSNVTIFHNPRCSKSRQTLALLEENGVEPTIIKYLETPPSAEQLRTVLSSLGINARDLLRTKEAEYAEAGLDNMDLSEDDVIDKMVEFPKLIERPIVIKGDAARIGRPPESVLEII